MSNDSKGDKLRETLSRIDPSPHFPEDEIRERISGTLASRPDGPASSDRPGRWHPYVKAVLAAAAALLVFIAGSEYGRRAALSGAAFTSASPAAPSDVPLSIQAMGTEYVAALTGLAEVANDLTAEEREQARQAALAVLYGAAFELLRLAPNDTVAATVFRTVGSERDAERDPGTDESIWF